MKQIVIALLFAAVVASVAATPDAPGPLRLERVADAMGSAYSVVLYGSDRGRLEAAADEALEEARRLDGLLSNYKPDSEWSRVNRDAAASPVAVGAELFGLLRACQGYSAASEGAFDITVGPLVKAWGFYKGAGRLPHRAELRAAMARVGWRKVELDERARTVRFATAGVTLDPGGIGKGYAVDRIVAVLRQHGVQSAFVSAGGSSLYGIGAPPNEPRGWKVTIRHPKEPSRGVADVFLKNQSMSTSGSYEKFFWADGRLYSHIFDPRTGYPAQGMLSVSVLAPRCLDSEAWTKPVYINGRAWAARRIPAGFRAHTCADRAEAECAWLP